MEVWATTVSTVISILVLVLEVVTRSQKLEVEAGNIIIIKIKIIIIY